MKKEKIDETKNKFSPDGEIEVLKELLAQPGLDAEKKEVIERTIDEWRNWKQFKPGDMVMFLLRMGNKKPVFVEGEILKKLIVVPMIEVETSGGEKYKINPSVLAKIEK